MIIPVILSGGIGSRLWPLSRESHPKPFIQLDDGESLLQKTYKRAAMISNSEEIVTVTNRELFFYTKDEFEDIDIGLQKNTLILEPVRRNSTAAIAVAAQYANEQYGPDCILLVMPADHLIDDVGAFENAVKRACELAEQGKLVTFGILPTGPATGFGYIHADGNHVKGFVEKPDRETAAQFIASQNYFWNSGMFCMNAGRFLEELTLHAPDIAEQSHVSITGAQKFKGTGWQQYELRHDEFSLIRDISVDYAIFEKSDQVAVVPCDIGWSDIGSWEEFGDLYAVDENMNNISGNVICKKTQNCILHGSHRLVATLGVQDLIVADTADALLVAHKDRTQDVREIVDVLKSQNNAVYKEFPKVHRPWGTYTVLQEGTGFKLKRIEVKPGGRLSLQSHKYRSEHWVVVSGKALVTNGEEQIELQPNQSTYIPLGNKHRLENPESEKLILIEVQCGEYLGEDDIERYDDVYGR